jgi:RNA polymerase sigma-70 factor (ECF subfamily)
MRAKPASERRIFSGGDELQGRSAVITMDEHQILQAVRKCLQGEVDAFEAIIVEFQKPVLNLAYRIVQNVEDARDVAQSVFAKSFGSLVSYSPRYKFFSWLYRIAINESLNFVDKRDRRVGPEAGWASAAPGPEAQLEAGELSTKIEHAMLRLEGRQRALIALSLDGLSYKEMALVLDLSEKRVKSNLFAARQKLRDFLGREAVPAHDR